MFGILLSHRDKVGFLPAFGDREPNLRAMRACKLVGKPLLHGFSVLGHDAHDHLVRD